MECSDLSSSGDYWFAFMEEDQVRSRKWFRKFLEGLVQEGGQEHVPEVSGVTGGLSCRPGHCLAPWRMRSEI